MRSGEQAIWEARMAQLPRLAGIPRAVDLSGLARALYRAEALSRVTTEPPEIRLNVRTRS